MKKFSISSVLFFAIFFGLVSLGLKSYAQTNSNVIKTLDQSNKDFVRWFNSGQIDSLMQLHHNDACLVAIGCGKPFIKKYYESESKAYKYKEIKVLSTSICDSIAIEKGIWTIVMKSGEEITGEYLTELRLVGEKWLIINDLTGVNE